MIRTLIASLLLACVSANPVFLLPDPFEELTHRSNHFVDIALRFVHKNLAHLYVPHHGKDEFLTFNRFGYTAKANVTNVTVHGLDSLARDGDSYISTLDHCSLDTLVTIPLALYNISATAKLNVTSYWYSTNSTISVEIAKISIRFLANFNFGNLTLSSGFAEIIKIEGEVTTVDNAKLLLPVILPIVAAIPFDTIADLNNILS